MKKKKKILDKIEKFDYFNLLGTQSDGWSSIFQPVAAVFRGNEIAVAFRGTARSRSGDQ